MAFSDELKRAQKEVNDKLNRIMRATAIKTFQRIIQESPVDTGRFRYNWTATVNTPNLSTNDNSSDDNIIAKIGRGTIKDVLYLTNNLPYAQRIEEGWSQQAPNGWVRVAVIDGQKVLDEETRKIGD